MIGQSNKCESIGERGGRENRPSKRPWMQPRVNSDTVMRGHSINKERERRFVEMKLFPHTGIHHTVGPISAPTPNPLFHQYPPIDYIPKLRINENDVAASASPCTLRTLRGLSRTDCEGLASRGCQPQIVYQSNVFCVLDNCPRPSRR